MTLDAPVTAKYVISALPGHDLFWAHLAQEAKRPQYPLRAVSSRLTGIIIIITLMHNITNYV